jgi:hypothetical protein
MKKYSLFLMLGAAFLTFNACKSELDLDKELKFSKLSVEEQKQKIEESGIEFVNAMEGIQETQAMTTMMNMLTMTGTEAFSAPMQRFSADIQNARKDAFSNFDKQMRVSYIDSEVWGEYEYNFDTEEMEKTESLVNKIILRFPATATATKNNAVITITYEESSVVVPDSDGEKYPSKITYTMTVDSKEVMSAEFSGTYYSDGSPKKVSQMLKIDDYKWTAEIANDQKTASESYEFKKGTKTMIKSVAEVSGKISADELQGAVDNESPQDAIEKFAVYFQVMNVAVKGGTSDFKSMADEGQALDSEKLSEKEYAEETAKILNKYMVCTAFFVDDNRKFADVELYVVEEVDQYTYYDWYQEKEVTVTEYSYDLAPRFVLSDGSKVDAEEYVQEGFEDLIKQLQDMTGSYDSK